jgi:Flp pilus assembly protein TadG
MSRLLARTRSEAGQAFVLVAVAMVALVGMAALVIDGGSWYQAQRHLQTSADAAALAGAQDLPNESSAQAVALDYAGRNDASVPAPAVTFPSTSVIDVRATATAPGILARIFGFNGVNIHAHAQAQVSVPLSMNDVAPVAVKSTAACAVSQTPPCFGQTVTVTFDESQISSSTIGLIDLTCHSSTATPCSGSPGGSDMGNQIQCTPCFPGSLPANQWYDVKTGETVGPIQHAFNQMVGQPLLFPVWDQTLNGMYHIVGWAAFVIEPGGVHWTSKTRQLTGHFTTFTATDLASGGTIGGATDFGVHVITLTQ